MPGFDSKRLFDIVVAGSALVILVPVLLATALVVRVSMGSPVLFRQKRPGLHGVPFELVKFRTMLPQTGSQGPLTDAQRLTKLGKFLRSTSVDELPELWNVLMGDMSLVGPRPLLMEYLGRYSREQARRLEVRPGITGWAQVNGRNALSWESRFELDTWYVNQRSLLLDIRILLMTVRQVLGRKDISAQGHETMPEFLGTTSPATDISPGKDELGGD